MCSLLAAIPGDTIVLDGSAGAGLGLFVRGASHTTIEDSGRVSIAISAEAGVGAGFDTNAFRLSEGDANGQDGVSYGEGFSGDLAAGLSLAKLIKKKFGIGASVAAYAAYTERVTKVATVYDFGC